MLGESVVVVVLQSVGVRSDHFILQSSGSLPAMPRSSFPASSPFFFPWPTSLPQQALEELAVLVEMVDGIVVVGARALHELVKVAWRVLLGLSACVIRHGDQRRVGRSTVILSILFPSTWRGPRPNPGAWPYLCPSLHWSTVGAALAGGVG